MGYLDIAAWASCICATEKLLTPMWRTIPRSTSSLHGPAWSRRWGRCGWAQWIWYRSMTPGVQQFQALFGGPQHLVVAQVAAQHLGGQKHFVPDAPDGGSHGVPRCRYISAVSMRYAPSSTPRLRSGSGPPRYFLRPKTYLGYHFARAGPAPGIPSASSGTAICGFVVCRMFPAMLYQSRQTLRKEIRRS